MKMVGAEHKMLATNTKILKASQILLIEHLHDSKIVLTKWKKNCAKQKMHAIKHKNSNNKTNTSYRIQKIWNIIQSSSYKTEIILTKYKILSTIFK